MEERGGGVYQGFADGITIIMKIAVLDYSSGCVDIFEVPAGEHIEWYLTEEKGYNMDNIYWMEAKCININIGM